MTPLLQESRASDDLVSAGCYSISIEGPGLPMTQLLQTLHYLVSKPRLGLYSAA